MSIFPLPVFEADADPSRRDALTDAEVYARLKPPSTIVVRVGRMGFVAEYPYDGDAKPGCGSKLVARTHRGTELVEMLTTTCGNSGCSKSVSRQEMLDYIERSGGSEYPFHTDGRILRVASVDDLNRWSQVQARARERVASVKEIVAASGLPMKVVDLEPILGEELLTIYFLSEERVDFRELVRTLAAECGTRIELRQVGARDEARLVADYERCGQHCCCKNFLKVLKPVSMRSAKVQKATLDPLKISGRCGRLMCCLRYEDETYEDLKRRLPRNKSRVGTAEGPGIVVDSKILVQLVLVQLEHDGREIAVPVEELIDPETCPKPGEKGTESDPMRGLAPTEVARRADDRRRGERTRAAQQDAHRARAEGEDSPAAPEGEPTKGRRRRRRRRGGGSGDDAPESASAPTPDAAPPTPPASGDANDSAGSESEQRKRRRRRRRRGGGGSPASDAPAGD
jgi:cell fate regulator YaaT (PSP1 superfamily)